MLYGSPAQLYNLTVTANVGNRIGPEYSDPAWEERSLGRETRRTLALIVGWLLLALYCCAVLFEWWPWLRGWGNFPEGWTWPLYGSSPIRFIPVICIVAAIWAVVSVAEFAYLVPMWSAGRQARNGLIGVLFLLAMIILGYGLQLSMLGLKSDSANRLLVERVTNRVFTGYFTLAAGSPSIDTFFSAYPTVFGSGLCPHCSDHPPGPGLFYWLSIQGAADLPTSIQHNLANSIWRLLGDSPGTAQLRASLGDTQILGAFMGGTLVLLLAAATVLPLFALARLLAPRGYAFRLAALGIVLPGLVLMAPEFDQVFAFIAACAIYCAVRGLLSNDALAGMLWGGTAGFLVAVGLYFSWAFITLLLALALIGLVCAIGGKGVIREGETGTTREGVAGFGAWLIGLGTGVVLPLALLMAFTGVDLVYIFRYNLQNDELTEAARPYAVWVFYGTLDFLQFLGLPLALACILVFAKRRRERNAPPQTATQYAGLHRPRRTPWYSGINAYSLVFWVTLISIEVAGKSKAEQGRTLIFLMPLALAAVYLWAGRTTPGKWYIAQLYTAQVLVCISIGARWLVP